MIKLLLLQKTPSTILAKPPAIAGQPQMAADFAPIASNMYQCMDIQCLCVFFRGSVGTGCTVQGRNLGKALRKEYRQLSDEERNRVHGAFQAIKSRGRNSFRAFSEGYQLGACIHCSEAGEEACYNGQCIGGHCTGSSTQTTPPPPFTPSKPVVVVQQICFNEHECCSYWAGIGECTRNPVYMSLWCKASCRTCQPKYDLNNERCASKIKPGGSCVGLNNGEEACYNGQCIDGRCTGASTQTTPPPPITPSKPVVVVQQTCFNEHECCSYWAGIGECTRNPVYMSLWCKASCRTCQPKYDLNN
ncbi:hypothetical protein GCK32_014803, partial [Trichostrongylus colubriformis]